MHQRRRRSGSARLLRPQGGGCSARQHQRRGAVGCLAQRRQPRRGSERRRLRLGSALRRREGGYSEHPLLLKAGDCLVHPPRLLQADCSAHPNPPLAEVCSAHPNPR